jgi:gas vesicle protein
MSERIYYSHEAAQRAYRERLIMALIVAGFCIGIGAVLALLLAPRTGNETRRQLSESIDQAGQHGRAVAESVIQNVRESASKLQEDVQSRLKKANS